MDGRRSVKTAARQLIDGLPEEASWDDLMYEIHVRQAIDDGLANVAAGRVTPASAARAHLESDAPER